MKGSNEIPIGKATRIESVLFGFGAFLTFVQAVFAGPGWLRDFCLGFAILFSAFAWFFVICYYRELDPYRILGLRSSPRLPS